MAEESVKAEPGGHEFKGVFIAIPCGSGSMRHQTVAALLQTMALLQANRIFGEVRIVPLDSIIMRARNALVSYFMTSQCSHMMWIDDDLEWDAKDVLRMIRDDKDWVCGAYRRKSDNETYTVAFPPEAEHHVVTCAHCGCVEIDLGNVGFAMVHRRVYEKMFEAYPELKCDNPPISVNGNDEYFYALFDTVVEDARLWGEDYAFARRWRKLGGRIWLDPAIVLTHYGVKGWTGNVKRWFLNAEPEKIEFTDAWKDIPGWLTDLQAGLLVEEMKTLPTCGTVIEFGSWKGRSTAVLGLAAAEMDREIRVYAIDHFRGSFAERSQAHAEAACDPDGVYPEFLENLGKLGVLGKTVVPLNGEFEEAIKNFRPSSVDLVFLDGDHAEGKTKAAFLAVEPLLKPGGTVVMHDYNWTSVRGDVESLGIEVAEAHEMAVWRKPEEAR